MDFWPFSLSWPFLHLLNFLSGSDDVQISGQQESVSWFSSYWSLMVLGLLVFGIVGFWLKDDCLTHYLVHKNWISRKLNSRKYEYQQDLENCRYCVGVQISAPRKTVEIGGLKHPVPLRPSSPYLISTTVIQDPPIIQSSHAVSFEDNFNQVPPTANVETNVPTAPFEAKKEHNVIVDSPTSGSGYIDFANNSPPSSPDSTTKQSPAGKKQQKRSKKSNSLKVDTEMTINVGKQEPAPKFNDEPTTESTCAKVLLHKRHNVHHYDDMDIPQSMSFASSQKQQQAPLYSPFSSGLSIPLQKQALSHSAPTSPTFESRPAPARFNLFNDHQKKQQMALMNLYEQQQDQEKEDPKYVDDKRRKNHSKRQVTEERKVTITDFRKAALSSYNCSQHASKSHVNHHHNHHEHGQHQQVRRANDDFSLFERRMSAVLGKSPDNW